MNFSRVIKFSKHFFVLAAALFGALFYSLTAYSTETTSPVTLTIQNNLPSQPLQFYSFISTAKSMNGTPLDIVNLDPNRPEYIAPTTAGSVMITWAPHIQTDFEGAVIDYIIGGSTDNTNSQCHMAVLLYKNDKDNSLVLESFVYPPLPWTEEGAQPVAVSNCPQQYSLAFDPETRVITVGYSLR